MEPSARRLELRDASLLSSESLGSGDAGDLIVDVSGDLELTRGSVIATAAERAFGGNIDLRVGSTLELAQQSKISTSVGSGEGDGGDVRIQGGAVVLDSSAIVARAKAGTGGDITIVADAFASTDSVVDASSDLGIDGRVVVDSPDSDIVGSLATLPGTFLDAAGLLRERCGPRAAASGGSFVVQPRAGLPAAPDGLLPASVAESVSTGPPNTSGRGLEPSSVAFRSATDCSDLALEIPSDRVR